MELFPISQSKDCLISNLAWETLDKMTGGFFGHERVDQLIAEGGRWFVQYKNGPDINYGVSKQIDLDAYKGQNLISVAGLVATHPFFKGVSVLVMLKNETLDDGMGFAVGLWNGNVRLDRPFLLTQAKSIVSEFELIGRGRPFVIWGDVQGVPVKTQYTLEALLVPKKGGKRLKVQPLKSEKKSLIFVIAVCAVIALMAASWGWDWYCAKQNELIERIRQTKKSPDYIYDQSVTARLSIPVLIAKEAVPAIAEQLNRFPIALGGWRLSTITCKELTCEAQWKSNGGTYQEFQKSADPAWGKIALASSDAEVLGDLKTLRHGFTLDLNTNPLPPQASWPTRSAFELATGGDWQKYGQLGWVGTLAMPAQQAVPTGVNPLSIKNHPHAIYAMPWSVNSQSWALTQKAIGSLPENVTLTEFKLSINEKERAVAFSGSGLAYVQK